MVDLFAIAAGAAYPIVEVNHAGAFALAGGRVVLATDLPDFERVCTASEYREAVAEQQRQAAAAQADAQAQATAQAAAEAAQRAEQRQQALEQAEQRQRDLAQARAHQTLRRGCGWTPQF